MAQKISILGATGSIGDSTLQVIAANPDDFTVSAVTAGNNIERLAEICHRFQPKFAAIADEASYNDFKSAVASLDIETACGEAGVLAAAAYPTDRVMAAITGFSGLKPTITALQNCSIVMLANKECLVAAGSLFMDIQGIFMYEFLSTNIASWKNFFLLNRFLSGSIPLLPG